MTRTEYKDFYVSSMLMEIRSGLPPLRRDCSGLREDEDEGEDESQDEGEGEGG